MYTITELHRQPPTQCYRPRLFFSIYYRVADNAFKNAAETWKTVVMAQEAFTANDAFYEKEISTEHEFKVAWQEIYQKATNENLMVWVGHLFTHSSKQTNGNDGLEFKGGDGDDGTLKQGEITALPKLPWAANSYLILAGCNSGLSGARGWNPAEVFSSSQGVKTLGQTGFGYFSENWSVYSRTSSATTSRSLWAYRRSANPGSDGARMPAIIFG